MAQPTAPSSLSAAAVTVESWALRLALTVPEPATLTFLRLAVRHGVQAEAQMTHKLTGREVYDALCVQGQGDMGEYTAGFSSTWIDGQVCFDALALRLNEIIVANGNHDAVVRAITGED